MISGYVYAEQGQYKKAIQLTREAIRIVRQIDEQNVIRSIMMLAGYYSNIGDTVRAFMLLDSALAMNPDMDNERWIYENKGLLYAASGNQEEVKKLIDILNMPEKQIGVTWAWDMPNILNIELYRLQGDVDKAILKHDNLEIYSYVLTFNLKARLFSAAHDWDNVISTTQEMESSRLFFNVVFDTRFHDYPRAFYYRGKAYEETGKPELAIENYEALLDLWKDADEEIPERRDAIKRLAALKQGS